MDVINYYSLVFTKLEFYAKEINDPINLSST